MTISDLSPFLFQAKKLINKFFSDKPTNQYHITIIDKSKNIIINGRKDKTSPDKIIKSLKSLNKSKSFKN